MLPWERFLMIRVQQLFVSALSVALVTSVAANGSAMTINGFANGGFETVGMSTPAEAWLGAASGYSLSTDARTGNFAAQLSSPAFNAAVMLQNSIEQGGIEPLIVGDNPLLSFWAKGTAGGTGNVLFALRYLDGVGNILSNSGNQFFQGSINPQTWTEITYDLGPVPAGATAAFIEFSQGIGPIDDNLPAGLVLIDDLSLTRASAVPEPTSVALLVLAGVAIVAGRKVVASRK